MKTERVEIRKEQSKLIKEKENQNLEIIRIKYGFICLKRVVCGLRGELEAKVEKFKYPTNAKNVRVSRDTNAYVYFCKTSVFDAFSFRMICL